MSKRRKVLVLLGLIALVVVCFFTLRPRDEPKYQGRYLSDWIAVCQTNIIDQTSPQFVEAQKAVRVIGTNAFPYFLKWMRYEVPPWRVSLYQKLPSWIPGNRTVIGWIYGDAFLRPRYGYVGLLLLGTNAVSAIPELEAMMRDRTKPECARLAMGPLINLGEPAIPVFQAVLADPHQADRYKILRGIREMTYYIGTKKCMPIFVAALTNDDARVRSAATNLLSDIAPEVLTNAPAR